MPVPAARHGTMFNTSTLQWCFCNSTHYICNKYWAKHGTEFTDTDKLAMPQLERASGMLVTDSVKRLLRDHLFSVYLKILLAAFSVKLVLVMCIHKLDWVKVLHPTPHKICHLGDDDPKPMSWLGMETRRPASADRTARRQFQATGQPVSRMQANDTMTSRLPRYEAKCV